MKILVTGSAGFIGYHVGKHLLKKEYEIIGLDNLNNYYDVQLKRDRLKELGIKHSNSNEIIHSKKNENYSFYCADLNDRKLMGMIFERHAFDAVIHLGAQAGVRYSLENPHSYIDSNISGFLNVIEGCRNQDLDHLIYASSSSVYGNNSSVPFNTSQQIDKPVSLYAATKKANELMAYTYSHLYNIPATGLRFFTVYGPWGRPDMAYYKFTEKILAGQPIEIYNGGDMSRDFTFVEDIVESIERLIFKPPQGKNPHRLFNIGYGSPVNLMKFIEILEKNLEVQANKKFLPMQPGDVPRTWADSNDLNELINYQPAVPLEKGIEKFVQWYKAYKLSVD